MPLTLFAKRSILDVWKSSKYASNKGPNMDPWDTSQLTVSAAFNIDLDFPVREIRLKWTCDMIWEPHKCHCSQ